MSKNFEYAEQIAAGREEKARKKKRAALIVGIMALAILPPVWGLRDVVFPLALRGDFIDAVVAGDMLWFETDGSFGYSSKTVSGGSTTVSSGSLFNKDFRYGFDLASGKIVSRRRIPYDDAPPLAHLIANGELVWRIAERRHETAPIIETFDAKTGERVTTTEDFVAAHPALGTAGLYAIRYVEDKKLFELTTKDARHFTFDAASGDLSYGQPSGAFTYVPQVHVPNFINPITVYCDATLGVILHQNLLGKGAHRVLTAVGPAGVLWNVDEALLPKYVRYDGSDPFNEADSIQSDISGDRYGDLLLMKVKGIGVIGFDVPTGKRFFDLEP